MTPKQILKNTFGYNEFRPLQEDIINTILQKKDSVVIMPTGGGKSLCFQIPALIFEGLTIVISPLISLMKDQAQQLNELGVNAIFLNSSLNAEKYRINEDLIREEKVKLLYVAPETLAMQKTINLLSTIKVDCITVDEAHCISEWGHDFRKEYRQISKIRLNFNNAVIAAFTATATPQVQKDIVKNLNLTNSKKFVSSFNRENLFLEISPKTDALTQTVNLLEKYPNQSGIIYCFSRKQVDQLYQELQNRNYSVRPYHAGLSDKERQEFQEDFIKDNVQIIVATIAFGMGINKPNVRFVIHYDLPKNIESYYQEIGRAGRDGLNAHCLLLFSYGDISKQNYFIDQKPQKEKQIAKAQLDSLIRYAETFSCRRTPLLNYFGENHIEEKCGQCDNCNTDKIDFVDITLEAQKFLSCVKRTGEIFGAMHIIDVLRGSKAQKIMSNNHNLLSTFGIGKELSKVQWSNLSRQFIQKQIIEKDSKYGSLTLTESGSDVLRGNLKIDGRFIEEQNKTKASDKVKSNYDQVLFDKLRRKRKDLADKSNLPPYVVFPDKTLIEMATYLPQTKNDLNNVHGIGEKKLKKYGNIFLKVIKTYCNSNGLKTNNNKKKTDALRKKTNNKLKYILVGEAYNNCHSFNELKTQFNVQTNTIISNLTKYVEEGNEIITDKLLDSIILDNNKKHEVFSAYDKLGTEYLKPVYDTLNNSVTYDELKILKVCYLATKN